MDQLLSFSKSHASGGSSWPQPTIDPITRVGLLGDSASSSILHNVVDQSLKRVLYQHLAHLLPRESWIRNDPNDYLFAVARATSMQLAADDDGRDSFAEPIPEMPIGRPENQKLRSEL